MAIVNCAAIECKHNKYTVCGAERIDLNESRVHTVHNGVEQFWRCKQFELSDEAKQIQAEYAKFLGVKKR